MLKSSTLTLLNVQARETDQYDFVCGVGYEDESRGFIQNSQVANSVRVNVHGKFCVSFKSSEIFVLVTFRPYNSVYGL